MNAKILSLTLSFLLLFAKTPVYAQTESHTPKYEIHHIVPLSNCLLLTVLSRDSSLGSLGGCFLGLALGYIDEALIQNGMMYVGSPMLIGSQALGSYYGKPAGALMGLMMAQNIFEPLSTIQFLKKSFHAVVLCKSLGSLGLVVSPVVLNTLVEIYLTLPEQELSFVSEIRDFFSKFLEEEDLRQSGSRQLMSILASRAFLVSFKDTIWASLFEMRSVFPDHKDDPAKVFEKISQKALVSLSYASTYLLIEMFFSNAQNALYNELVYKVRERLEKKYYKDENPLALSLMNQSHLILHMDEDFESLRTQGSSLLVSELANKIDILHSSSVMLANNAWDYYGVLLIYSKIVEEVTHSLAELSSQYKSEMMRLNTFQNTIAKESLENADLLVVSRNLPDLYEKKRLLNEEVRQLSDNKLYLDTVFNVWKGGKDFFDSVFANLVFGWKFKHGSLQYDPAHNIDERGILGSVGCTFASAMSWGSANAPQISNVKLAIQNIENIDEKLNSVETLSCDTLKHEFQIGDHRAIEFKDVHIYSKDGIHSLKIPELKISEGFYAVTGVSGSGKSTFLRKIFGMKKNEVCAEGMLTFRGPTEDDVFFVSQDFYSNPNSTLFQILTKKRKEDLSEEEYEKLRLRIVELFKEIRIDESVHFGRGLVEELETVKDWKSSTALSGGQRKKVSIVSMILSLEAKTSSFIILDEIFAGLDPLESLPIVKTMLKKHLKNAVVLMVDHDEKDFFDKKLSFERGTVTLTLSDL